MIVFCFCRNLWCKMEERGSQRPSPTGFPGPLPAYICCCGRDGTPTQRRTLCLGDQSSQDASPHLSTLNGEYFSRRISAFTLIQAEACLKFAIMSQSWCGQAILRVELGILVAVLVVSGMAQIYERREEGSSCYGGFDLYFVLDKWVLLLLDNLRRSSFRVWCMNHHSLLWCHRFKRCCYKKLQFLIIVGHVNKGFVTAITEPFGTTSLYFSYLYLT